jgi:hypothetical protein
MFSIKFITDPVPDLEVGEKAAFGIIQIGDFKERFIASLNFWNVEEYERQWIQGLTRVVNHESESALITSLTDPKNTNFITWWPIYRTKEIIYFQNQFLFLADLSAPFNPRDSYRHVPPRTTKTEDGKQPISEWKLPIAAIENFLNA